MRIAKWAVLVLLGVLVSLQAGAVSAAPATVDLTKAVVVASPSADAVELQAANLLRWEVQRRTGIEKWGLANGEPATDLPADDVPAILVGSIERVWVAPAAVGETVVSQSDLLFGLKMRALVTKDGKPAAEGFVVAVHDKVGPLPPRRAPTVFAIGADHRGTLFAVGRLLRSLDWAKGSVKAPANLNISSAPAYPIRGMQLGYRALNDTLDAWDVGQYTQYFRDLIAFGCNSVEFIPGIRPGAIGPANPSPVMKMTPWDMTMALSAVCRAYDIDVWYWLPLSDGGALNEGVIAETLREREELFAASPRIDNIFIPGGDPGNTPPELLMPYLERLAAVLHKYFPKAGVWVSPQGFEIENLNYFYEYLQKNQPDWLGGVVYGPWVKDTIEHCRQAVPAKYPIRLYPDITHTVRNQYPIPHWDDSWFQAYERQPIMPCPVRMAHLSNLYNKLSSGAICYSDGTGDDVNKIVCAALLWDPKADLKGVLREYGRYFIGPEYADDIAEGDLMLEQNWAGPALTNAEIPKTLAYWQALEKRATPEALGNWRFQQGLIRAYGDAYVQKRLQRETPLLEQGYAELRKAHQVGADQAMAAAERILMPITDPVAAAPELHARILELADALNKSIGMQLSIERQHGFRVDRGALLDTIDRPISDASWLLYQVSAQPLERAQSAEGAPTRLRDQKTEPEKLAAIDAVLNWENPGPGGFYDDLGDGAHDRQPHLVPGPGYEKDPGFVVSPQDEQGGPDFPGVGPQRWFTQGTTVYDTPLRLRYTGLDPRATYLFKATYAGRYGATVQLYLGDDMIGEPFVSDRHPVVRSFEVPRSAIVNGVLEVSWKRVKGRGTQIAEAWLVKKK